MAEYAFFKKIEIPYFSFVSKSVPLVVSVLPSLGRDVTMSDLFCHNFLVPIGKKENIFLDVM